MENFEKKRDSVRKNVEKLVKNVSAITFKFSYPSEGYFK